jgi:hypothetical protein
MAYGMLLGMPGRGTTALGLLPSGKLANQPTVPIAFKQDAVSQGRIAHTLLATMQQGVHKAGGDGSSLPLHPVQPAGCCLAAQVD